MYLYAPALVPVPLFNILFFSQVGLRMINPTADRPVSDKVQEQIDTEVNKILQVRIDA